MWGELYPNFWDFWNFFNFAKPLIDEAILSKYVIFVLFIAVVQV